MITHEELNQMAHPTTPEIDENLNTLFARINLVRDAWGKPMIVTSGLRSEGQQAGLIRQGKSNAVHSWHLVGAACDILDRDGALHAWCKENGELLEKIGFWMEERQGIWQHFQIYPPKSGNRWFYP